MKLNLSNIPEITKSYYFFADMVKNSYISQ